MQQPPAVLKHCLEDSATLCGPLLAQCVDAAVEALQQLELRSMKVAERDQLANAWRQLSSRKAALVSQYPVDLQAAFSASVAASESLIGVNAASSLTNRTTAVGGSAGTPLGDASFGGERAASLNLDSLTLVDDASVSQAIDSQRLLQQLLPGLEQKLAELDALISSALGLPNVMPDSNPLRPQEFTRVLQNLITAPSGDPTLPVLWVKHMAEPLGQGLQKIYAKAIAQLESADVQAAQYRVLPTPLGVAGGGGRGGGANFEPNANRQASDGHDSANGGLGANGSNGYSGDGTHWDQPNGEPSPSVYADLSDQGVRQDFFNDFLFQGGNNSAQRLAPAYYEQVEQELRELNEQSDDEPETSQPPSSYQHLPAVDRPQRTVNAASHLSTGAWGNYGQARRRTMVRTQLKKEATQVGQVMGLEVVRQLVNQVAQDPRLLAPVREAIVALEPSLLRLAMVDPRFFSDERHVGRQLMERVAQRSFKYNDEYSSEFVEFFEGAAGVNGAFNKLNDSEVKNTQPFALALHTLESAWNQQDQQEDAKRQAVLLALRFAEERQAKADEIAFDLSGRSDLQKVPGMVLDFLFGPWALVMAHARLVDKRNQIDPEGYGSVVPDLIWSVKHEATLKQPAKFVAMVPGMLDKMRGGLKLLGQSPEESDSFFQALMKLHKPVLKLRRLKSQRDAEESNMGALEEAQDPHELAEGLDAQESATTPLERLEKIRAEAHSLWLGRNDQDAAGFEDTQPSSPTPLDTATEAASTVPDANSPQAEPDAPQTETAVTTAAQEGSESAAEAEPAGPITKEQAQAMLLDLRAGNWVDLYSKRGWLRAQLIWASTKSTLFMFVSHGGQPHSMTSRSCEKLMMQNLLRVVDTSGVVAQALSAVTGSNSAPSAPRTGTGLRRATEDFGQTA